MAISRISRTVIREISVLPFEFAGTKCPPAFKRMREIFAVLPSITPRYARISDWCVMSGMGRSLTYEALGRGNLKAIKLGTRTLIDVAHGLAWLASMPAAEITTGRKRGPSSASAPESDPGAGAAPG
jgi:hypothetical protein